MDGSDIIIQDFRNILHFMCVLNFSSRPHPDPNPLVCFSTGYGECLLDEPVGRTYELPTLLPGQIYNANRQCELMFGPGSQICPYLVSRHMESLPCKMEIFNSVINPPSQKQCKRLWCTSAEGDHKGCRTQHMPLADGTECGHGMVRLSTSSI